MCCGGLFGVCMCYVYDYVCVVFVWCVCGVYVCGVCVVCVVSVRCVFCGGVVWSVYVLCV